MDSKAKPSSSTLAGLGEDRLVQRLTSNLSLGADVIVGAGDDCAVIGKPRGLWWELLKTDSLVEGIHFLPDEKPERVGRKALCRNLSDIAAMGGEPLHALITIAAKPETRVSQIVRIYRGLERAARSFGVSIVGGETSTSTGPMFLSVALTGRVRRRRCVFRSGGRPGDQLYVTGRLGGSIKGRHLDFTPRLAEAQWLVSHCKPTAMMDLSDGLGADLPRLAAASKCSFELEEQRVPRSASCSLRQALGDGEDYELLFAVNNKEAPRLEREWKRRFPALPLTCIGRLVEAGRKSSRLTAHGYHHFT